MLGVPARLRSAWLCQPTWAGRGRDQMTAGAYGGAHVGGGVAVAVAVAVSFGLGRERWACAAWLRCCDLTRPWHSCSTNPSRRVNHCGGLGRASVPRFVDRISLVTLGVADLARARAVYQAMGWRGA